MNSANSSITSSLVILAASSGCAKNIYLILNLRSSDQISNEIMKAKMNSIG